MCERAAHLVDGVFEAAPVRQWVLTLPHRLRYRLAYDHRLCRAVLGVYARTLLRFQRRLAREQGVDGRGGAVTAIQRCGSALNMNIHFHTLVAEGVFEGGIESPLRFVPSSRPPSDIEVARLLAAVRRRIIRLVRKHGIELEAEEGEGGEGIDPLFEEQPALATIQGASVLGRVVTGPRAGRWVVRLGRNPRADVVISGGRRQAHMRGAQRQGEQVTLRVSDEGIGIGKGDLASLFQPFHRGENAGDIPGFGLGLAIARRAVTLHGGTLEVESEPGRGTTFVVTIPAGDAVATESPTGSDTWDSALAATGDPLAREV